MKNLEDILRSKDKGYEVVPSERVWERLEESLDKKSRFSFWILPLLLTLGYALLALSSYRSQNGLSIDAEEKISTASLAQSEKSHSNQTVLLDSAVPAKENSGELTAEHITPIKKSSPSTSNQPSSQHVLPQSLGAENPKAQPIKSEGNEPAAPSSTNRDVQPRGSSAQDLAATPLANRNVHLPVSGMYLNSFAPENELVLMNSTTSMTSPKRIKPLAPVWSIQGYYGFQRTYRNFKEKNRNDAMASMELDPLDTAGGASAANTEFVSRDFERANWNRSFGLMASRRNGRFAYRMGVHWSRYSYTIPYVEYRTDTVITFDNVYTQYAKEFVSIDKEDKTHENRMDYLGLSFGASYDLYWNKHRFTPYLDAHFRQAYQYSFGAYQPSLSRFYLFNNSGGGINTYNVAYEVGFEYSYVFNRNWNVYASPFFNADLRSNSKHKGYRERFNAAGLKLGLSYSFGM